MGEPGVSVLAVGLGMMSWVAACAATLTTNITTANATRYSMGLRVHQRLVTQLAGHTTWEPM